MMDSDIIPDAELDCVGLYCPTPIAMTKEEIDKIEVEQVLKVEADDPSGEEDIFRWAKRTGHEILKFEKDGTILIFYIKGLNRVKEARFFHLSLTQKCSGKRNRKGVKNERRKVNLICANQ